MEISSGMCSIVKAEDQLENKGEPSISKCRPSNAAARLGPWAGWVVARWPDWHTFQRGVSGCWCLDMLTWFFNGRGESGKPPL